LVKDPGNRKERIQMAQPGPKAQPDPRAQQAQKVRLFGGSLSK